MSWEKVWLDGLLSIGVIAIGFSVVVFVADVIQHRWDGGDE